MKKMIILAALALLFAVPCANAALGDQLSGKIILQVERNGEAWYVHPETRQRHFLFRPAQAFQVMREQGIGISNDNLEKIPIGFYDLSGPDGDGDGLANDFEVAIGTNWGDTDSDDDGVNDKDEVLAGRNPLGSGYLPINNYFSRQ